MYYEYFLLANQIILQDRQKKIDEEGGGGFCNELSNMQIGQIEDKVDEYYIAKLLLCLTESKSYHLDLSNNCLTSLYGLFQLHHLPIKHLSLNGNKPSILLDIECLTHFKHLKKLDLSLPTYTTDEQLLLSIQQTLKGVQIQFSENPKDDKVNQ